jgi:hypothetical protein
MAFCVNKQDVGIDDKINESKLWEQTELTMRLVVSYNKMDLAAFLPGNYSRTASRVDLTSLDLE